MLTVLVAAALAASPAPIADAKPDPVKDQVMICTAALVDKLQALAEGQPPISLIVPLYTDAAGMSDADAQQFAKGCALFEQGFLLAVQAQKKDGAKPMDSDGAKDEGLAPDHSTDDVQFTR